MAEAALHPIQSNFTAGELSPLLAARSDFDRYQAGLETCENWLVLPYGGVRTAWGTTYVGEVKDVTKPTRLIPFQFSVQQAYILEFGEGYIRVYRNNGQIGAVITNCVNNGSGLIRVISANHTLKTGDTIFIDGVQGVPAANGYWTVTVIDANTFDLQGSTFSGSYTGGGKWRVEISTPYLAADLWQLKYAQSADVLYLVHPDYKVRKLERTSHTTWKLSVVSFVGGPFRTQPVGETRTITPSGTTGNITLTASANLFTADHVGALWELTHGSTTGYVEITGYTSPTVVSATVKKALGGTTATSTWREGMWSAERGFPAAVTIHEDRLILGGSAEDPAVFVGSVSGKYEDMTEGTKDDDSFVFQIGSDQVPSILWFLSLDALLIGTASGEFKAQGGNNSGITPTNIFVRRQTSYGSKDMSALAVDEAGFFVQRSGRKLRRLSFALQADQYTADDMTLLAEHITESGLKELSYHAEPYGIIWGVRNDGRLVSLTTLERQDIRAWAKHYSPAHTAGAIDSFESITTIPHPDGDRDQTWVVVRRELPGGVYKRYIERMDDTVSMHSALRYTGTPTNVVSGLTHLEGRVVGIVGDGAVYPSKIVAGGQVTLDGNPASDIVVGIVYPCTLKTVRPEAQLPDGTTQGRKRKWAYVLIRFYQALGVTFRTSEQPVGETLEFRKGSDPMDAPPPVFTGFKRITTTGWGQDGQIVIEQREPLSATVLGIAGKVQYGDI